MPIPTEEQQLEARIQRRFRKAIREFQLIEDGDSILIGLSGGKDSLCLLELLGRQMRISKPAIKVHAIHIRMSNIHYETDTSYLEQFANSYGVPLHVVETGFDMATDSRKSPCFLCSWNRRKQMFLMAQQLGCNKIALGHHMDDIIHTALMNQIFQGHFSTMPARLRMRKMPITIIRPLCMQNETDIRRLAELRGYRKQKKLCPYETDSHRSDVAQLFASIEQMAPEARYSLWNALQAEGKLVEE